MTYWINKTKRIKYARDIRASHVKKLIREKNTVFPHPVGIVIAETATIGNNCKIFQNVTIGANAGLYPVIEDNVTIYANAVIIGDVHIGKNAVIGAGSVVLHDVPENEIWAGNPAHFIKKVEEGRNNNSLKI